MKICRDCTFYLQKSDIWYDQFCTNFEGERAIHPQTGAKCFVSTNDLGKKVFSDQRHPHARDINPEGKCEFFVKKREEVGGLNA